MHGNWERDTIDAVTTNARTNKASRRDAIEVTRPAQQRSRQLVDAPAAATEDHLADHDHGGKGVAEELDARGPGCDGR